LSDSDLYAKITELQERIGKVEVDLYGVPCVQCGEKFIEDGAMIQGDLHDATIMLFRPTYMCVNCTIRGLKKSQWKPVFNED
jgi:uncharacterized protein with PIN domain